MQEYITPKEAADLAGCKKRNIIKKLERADIQEQWKAKKVGKYNNSTWIIDKDAFTQFLSRQQS